MINTPATCHHTEMSLSSATSLTLKMFMIACNARITAYT